MLKEYLGLPDQRLGVVLQRFATALNSGRFSIKRDLSFIFLCGANRPELIPSERRQYLKKTIEAALPHARIVYAERVMDELVKHGKTKNLLDIEYQISRIADWILIVLESYSSFCELGAFATDNLRSKLIVINDSNFRSHQSFINLGPLQAIVEDVAEDRVIWYPMQSSGITIRDAIGMTLPTVLKHLRNKHTRTSLNSASCFPNIESQASLFFLHDIIYLCGPITHSETIEIYRKIYGNQSFNEIKALRAILHAAELITTVIIDNEPAYLTVTPDTFINIDTAGKDLLSAFRRFHLKHNSARLIHA